MCVVHACTYTPPSCENFVKYCTTHYHMLTNLHRQSTNTDNAMDDAITIKAMACLEKTVWICSYV